MTPEAIGKAVELADFEKMEEIRRRVDAEVKDAETAEALKPYYRQFCKRPCFHNEYLATFNRPNVTLVDTQGKGVERLTPRGAVVDGKEYAVDCLIYASGFEVGTDYSRRAGLEILGRDGVSLSESWADGIRTLHGMHVHGFPNCFIMSNAQAGFTASYPHLLNEQAKHLAYIVRHAEDEGIEAVEATTEGEQAWVERCIRKARTPAISSRTARPAITTTRGGSAIAAPRTGFYGGGSVEFFRLLEDWREAGALEGLAKR